MIKNNLSTKTNDLNTAIELVSHYQKNNHELDYLRQELQNFSIVDAFQESQKIVNLFINIKLFINNSIDFFDNYSEKKYGINFCLYKFIKESLAKCNGSIKKGCTIQYQDLFDEFLKHREKKGFLKDYKVYRLLLKLKEDFLYNIETISEDSLIALSDFNHNRKGLNHDILFLQKCYEYKKDEKGEYYNNIDYYKALDADSYRKRTNSSYGTWVCKNEKALPSNDYFALAKTSFNWSAMMFEETIYNKALRDEIEALPFSCFQEEIMKLTKNRIIIVSNASLNYETIIEEYYNHFGMDPKEFAEYIHLKYDCEIICPNIQTQSTYLARYRKLG